MCSFEFFNRITIVNTKYRIINCGTAILCFGAWLRQSYRPKTIIYYRGRYCPIYVSMNWGEFALTLSTAVDIRSSKDYRRVMGQPGEFVSSRSRAIGIHMRIEFPQNDPKASYDFNKNSDPITALLFSDHCSKSNQDEQQ